MLDCEDEKGWTPLLLAARRGHQQCISALLDPDLAATADIHHRDKKGRLEP